MKTLYLDCGMGAAGDMLTAALLELHPGPASFLERLNAALPEEVTVSAAADEKCGLRGTHVSVVIEGDEEGENDGHRHRHTSVQEICARIDALDVPAAVKADVHTVYDAIAQAESEVHGYPVENIHLHEVGSWDALADVLAVCWLLYELQPDQILASPIHVGSGMVKCAHGLLPVPAPATERLLRGIPMYGGSIRGELCTPTGAALLRHFVGSFGPMPRMRVEKSGFGTGKKDFEAANGLRALWGETDETGSSVLELCCNLDDMSGEAVGFAMERLLDAGALDVYTVPIGMKKSRPGIMLTCMCRAVQRDEMLRLLFRHTTTLGVREYVCARYTMQRSFRTEETPYGPVRIKTAEGWGVKREKAEYEDLARIACEQGISLREAREAAENRHGE